MRKLEMEKGLEVWILRRDEVVEAEKEKLLLSQSLKKIMETPRSCKMEKIGEYYAGTMKIPRKEKGDGMTFGFFLDSQEKKAVFLEDSGHLESFLEENLDSLGKAENEQMVLVGLLHLLIQDDVIQLERLEEGLFSLEEELLKRIPENFQERTARYRRRLFTLHTYYEQLANLADKMEDDPDLMQQGKTVREWGWLAEKAERLHDHVETLREYLLQIRELYLSRTAEQQNRIMTLLTVITTIFLPLTLIAGWYGMNFPNMPELHWRYGYIAVIAVSTLTVILEILYFRKKKML